MKLVTSPIYGRPVGLKPVRFILPTLVPHSAIMEGVVSVLEKISKLQKHPVIASTPPKVATMEPMMNVC